MQAIMLDINPAVQDLMDIIVKHLDKLSTQERNTAVDQLRCLLEQKYGTSSSNGTTVPTNVGAKVQRQSRKRQISQKVLIKTEPTVHCGLQIPSVRNTYANLLTLQSDNSIESITSESQNSFINIVMSNGASKEVSSTDDVLTNANEELSGYFINYPEFDRIVTDGPIIDKYDDEIGPNTTKEINVHIHCQRPYKSQKEKRQYMKKTIKCSVCIFETDKKQDFISHMKEHEELKQYTCSICGRGFLRASGLKAHEKRHSGKRDFECDICALKTYTKSEMARHMYQHRGGREFVCHYCGKMFVLESTLRVHVKTIHERKEKYPCDQCNFSTYHKPNLRMHVKVHHTDGSDVYKMTCPICHIRIQQKSTYIDHMRSHTGEKPFRCNCGREFACVSRLNAHMKNVHTPRQFPCSSCNKMFQTTHHLQRHTLIHTNERPFKCPKCKHASNTQGNLTKHMRNTHRISDFSFKKCKLLPALPESATVEESIKMGQIISEEYLADLSAKTGKTVTLEELKKVQEEKVNKPKPKVISKKEQKKNERRTKFEHSYHLVELLGSTTEDSLELPVLDSSAGMDSEMKPIEELSTVDDMALTHAQSEQSVYLDDDKDNVKMLLKSPKSHTLLPTDNIYHDLEDDTNNAEESILYGEIAEELYVDNSVAENIDNQYTLYEVNDSSEILCESDYSISLNPPSAELTIADDIILMINDGILIIGEEQEES